MKLTGYNFQRLRSALNAAESAQEAGYDEQAKSIITKMANDILDSDKEQARGGE